MTLEWTATKANGTEIKTTNYYDTDTAVFYVLPDRFDDCQINAVVKAKAETGVFGKVTWGADSEALAVQQRLAGDNRYETAMKVADQMMAKYGRFETK